MLNAPSDLRARLAQLIFPRIGSNLPPVRTVSEDEHRVARLLAETPIGGLCLFNGSWPATAASLARLQAMTQTPLLVASDLERGAGQHIAGLTLFPHAMAAGRAARRRASLVRDLGYRTGSQARACGVQLVMGPVADVNSDPRNPIIATRAFSTNAHEAAECVGEFIRGCQSSGAFCVAKHFPGHGNTHVDSHSALPFVDASKEQLMSCDLVPFVAALTAGVRLIMTAHVAFPALDPSGKPATISRPILQGLLREELGFDGLIVTDSLQMSGIRDRFSDEASMACEALQAGADVLLDVVEPAAVIAGLEQRIAAGTLSEATVQASFERVWRLKQEVFAVPPPVTEVAREPNGDAEIPDRMAAEQLALDIAREAIVELPSAVSRTPPSRARPLGLLVIKSFDTRWDPPEQPLVAALRQWHPDLVAWQCSPSAELPAEAWAAIGAVPQLVIALIVKPAAWHRFGLLPEHADRVRHLCETRELSLISLGVPTVLDDFPQAARRLCTFSDVAVSQQAMAEKLCTNGGVTP